MIYWWRRSLAAQFIGFVLVTLVVSQALSFFISRHERERALYAASKSEFYTRATSITRLMGSVPADLRQQALEASETTNSRFWMSETEPSDPDAWRRQAADELARPLANFVDFPQHTGFDVSSAIDVATRDAIASANPGEPWATPSEATWSLPQAARFTAIGGSSGFGLAIRFDDGTWLNSAYYNLSSTSWWSSQTLYSLAATAILLSVIGIFAANRIARPLKRLAASAEAIGRGENVPPLPEEGTDDIRQTIAAFNRMQARLFRFIEDRTRMLAAIGHDLRTPLTSLRLRAEFVTDPDVQQRMLATIDEIQTMTEATIAFARGEATVEETRVVDLNALVGSLCDDLAEMGEPVVYLDGTKLT
ncbi:MAG: HAMP domain-containing protein, partial [Pararhizobium sp.]